MREENVLYSRKGSVHHYFYYTTSSYVDCRDSVIGLFVFLSFENPTIRLLIENGFAK